MGFITIEATILGEYFLELFPGIEYATPSNPMGKNGSFFFEAVKLYPITDPCGCFRK